MILGKPPHQADLDRVVFVPQPHFRSCDCHCGRKQYDACDFSSLLTKNSAFIFSATACITFTNKGRRNAQKAISDMWLSPFHGVLYRLIAIRGCDPSGVRALLVRVENVGGHLPRPANLLPGNDVLAKHGQRTTLSIVQFKREGTDFLRHVFRGCNHNLRRRESK